MCSPAFAAQGALTGIQMLGQQQQSKAIGKHQAAVFERTQTNAAKASTDAYRGYLARSQQVREAAALDVAQAARESQRALAAARVGTAGITGATSNDAAQAIALQASEFQAVRARNLSWEEQQIQEAMEGVRSQEQNRVLGALPKPQAGPDYVGLLGGLAVSGLGAYTDSLKDTSKTNSGTSLINFNFGGN